MILFTLIAAYIPYEQGERYSLGEHVEAPMLAALGGMIVLGLMFWCMRKAKNERQRRAKKRVE